MIGGRRPAPAKVVEGAFPAAPIEIDRPAFVAPDPVDWATRSAQLADEKWTAVTEAMAAAQTLSPANASMIEALCRVYARWKLAEECIAATGPILRAEKTGVPMHNPYLSIANKALAQLSRLEGELGLPPTVRERVGKVAGVKRKALAADGYLNKRAAG